MAHPMPAYMAITPPPQGTLSHHLELECFGKKRTETALVKIGQSFERLPLPEYVSNDIFTMPDGIANMSNYFLSCLSSGLRDHPSGV